MNIRTQSVHFTADQKLLDYLENRLNQLEKYMDEIIDIAVILKLENSGQVRDKIVEVNLKVPGQIFVAHGSKKTFEAAIDDVQKTLKRQVKRHKEKIIDAKRHMS
jgi:putative sigma-54 modulation protein